MWKSVLTAAVLAFLASGAEQITPSKFYVVSQAFSDFGPSFYYRVLDVSQDGPDVLVRYSRVAPVGLICRHEIVQAAETKIPQKSVADLIGSSNPCAFKPSTLDKAFKHYKMNAGVFETISFGIVAQCGSEVTALRLPIPEKVNLHQLQKENPGMAGLWDLMSRVSDTAFHADEIFQGLTDEVDMEMQKAGQKFVPELTSGKYDAGLAAAVAGNIGTWKSPSFRSLLANYRGPVLASSTDEGAIPQLENPDAYRFDKYVAPTYIPLAKMARVQGEVTIDVTVEPSTGDVLSASLVSGHALLAPSALEAARKWKFAPDSAPSGRRTVVFKYEIACTQ